jgi:hypothetical protein
MGNKKINPEKDALWAKAKYICRLNAEDIRMAKELGLNPRSLMKNIPSQSQPWKAPVKILIRNMYMKRREKQAGKRRHDRHTEKSTEFRTDIPWEEPWPETEEPMAGEDYDDNIPF